MTKEKSYILDIRNEIRSYMVAKGHTYKSVAALLKDKLGENITAQGLNNKLARGSLRYMDAKMIAEVLGYKIKWE
ncbi:MAG: LLM class flavin-dependent oxidoreductase [bacterium]|nr:LLM class flavin-dependent oxidoreductase [bacterium]